MTTRSEREKKQKQNERYKTILAKLLAKEENKYCADCRSKGPRWVSWNLGVLLCIRCSGIHRSLGVHISKVKSVNLDTWTSEQIVRVCSRGNGWAKEYYEANLAKDFKRPAGDSSLEYFIRDKYEKKKYCSARELPLRSIEEFKIYDDSNDSPSPKVSTKKISNGSTTIPALKRWEAAPSIARPKSHVVPSITASAPKQAENSVKPPTSNVNDLLGMGAPAQPPAVQQPATVPETKPPPSADLTFDLFASIQAGNESSPHSNDQTPSSESNSNPQTSESKLMSKDSILSLYGSNPPAMNPYPNPYSSSGGAFGMPAQAQMTFGQQPQAQMAINNQYNMQQPVGMGMQMNGMAFANQQMHQQQQQQQFQWQQQQQLQQQMHNMQLGGAAGFGANQQSGMRSYSSMPQMSGVAQQQPCSYGNQLTPGNLTHNGLASSQPSLVGVDQGMGSSWGPSAFNAGQTLSTQLWK